mmetsp:Transcript_96788/g.273755  ORF Transcript_96788/g.273755 Transcript_96788/m.273755 type:complete len:216 (+) Transcript_96788:1318-1965(+)
MPEGRDILRSAVPLQSWPAVGGADTVPLPMSEPGPRRLGHGLLLLPRQPEPGESEPSGRHPPEDGGLPRRQPRLRGLLRPGLHRGVPPGAAARDDHRHALLRGGEGRPDPGQAAPGGPDAELRQLRQPHAPAPRGRERQTGSHSPAHREDGDHRRRGSLWQDGAARGLPLAAGRGCGHAVREWCPSWKSWSQCEDHTHGGGLRRGSRPGRQDRRR